MTGISPENEISIADRMSYDQDGDWFIVHVLSGHEQKVQGQIMRTIAQKNVDDRVYDVIIPQCKRTSTKSGKKRVYDKKFFPGYILLRLALYDSNGRVDPDVWEFTSNINGLIGFLGDRPTALSRSELESISAQMLGETSITPETDYAIGECVVITDGPFINFEGVVESIDSEKDKIRLNVNIFDRLTPVDVERWQIERI